ncbi:MAG: pseudouridylate synthase [Candidatus Accumulibacter meliphilus]|uniref:tRNA pseudouridine synthase C n=1 Tax=Candidatus Accumulibacter meliphilus TaxID=2211374 RepID=A0A369XUH1_9PROT|nr:MAG: pseudouridylate synthase [Candidatus Accumulibacter meliphilus]
MLPIIYQDQHLVAIHKPAGLLVHRSIIDRSERRFALQMLRDQLGQRVYAVHRLDKGTSGVLLFALSSAVGRALSTSFEQRQVGKNYLAVVRGHPPLAGEIDHPLRRHFDTEGARAAAAAVAATNSPTQDACTRYRRLATIELPHRVDRYPSSRYALIELEPLSGRRHQLRRHLKHIAHPIIGDATHGKGRHNRLFQTLFACHRLLLACTELRLAHPVTGAELTLRAPLANDFYRLLARLEWTAAVPLQWLPDGTAGELDESPGEGCERGADQITARNDSA